MALISKMVEMWSRTVFSIQCWVKDVGLSQIVVLGHKDNITLTLCDVNLILRFSELARAQITPYYFFLKCLFSNFQWRKNVGGEDKQKDKRIMSQETLWSSPITDIHGNGLLCPPPLAMTQVRLELCPRYQRIGNKRKLKWIRLWELKDINIQLHI